MVEGDLIFKSEPLPFDLGHFRAVMCELKDNNPSGWRSGEGKILTLIDYAVVSDRHVWHVSAPGYNPDPFRVEWASVVACQSEGGIVIECRDRIRADEGFYPTSAVGQYSLEQLVRAIIAALGSRQGEMDTNGRRPASAASVTKDALVNKPDSQRPLRVFLCHASNDEPTVRELCRRLSAEGIDAWLAEEKLLPGQDWQQEIPKAVRDSDVVLVCLSRSSINKAGYVQKEIRLALDVADEQPEGAIFLIPAKLEECEVPDRLRRRQWVNYYEEAGWERLMRALAARSNELGIATLPISRESPRASGHKAELEKPEPGRPKPVHGIVQEAAQREAERQAKPSSSPAIPNQVKLIPDFRYSSPEGTSNGPAAFNNLTLVSAFKGDEAAPVVKTTQLTAKQKSVQTSHKDLQNRVERTQSVQPAPLPGLDKTQTRQPITGSNTGSKQNLQTSEDQHPGLEELEVELLQKIYDHFVAHDAWPRYRDLELDLRHIVPLYQIVSGIDNSLLVCEDLTQESSVCFLKLRGIAQCKGSETDIYNFLTTANLFAGRYIADRATATVTDGDLASELGMTEMEAHRICELLLRVGGGTLWSSASSTSDRRKCEFHVSPKAWYFEGVSNLESYFDREAQAIKAQIAEAGRVGRSFQAQGTLTTEYLAKLRRNLAEHFNKEELRTLCFDLGIEHEDLPETKNGMARELVARCERTGHISELVAKCGELRPRVSWEDKPE